MTSDHVQLFQAMITGCILQLLKSQISCGIVALERVVIFYCIGHIRKVCEGVVTWGDRYEPRESLTAIAILRC